MQSSIQQPIKRRKKERAGGGGGGESERKERQTERRERQNIQPGLNSSRAVLILISVSAAMTSFSLTSSAVVLVTLSTSIRDSSSTRDPWVEVRRNSRLSSSSFILRLLLVTSSRRLVRSASSSCTMQRKVSSPFLLPNSSALARTQVSPALAYSRQCHWEMIF